MQNFHVTAKKDQALQKRHQVRFQPAVHLTTGDLVGAFVETSLAFDDRPIFKFSENQPSISDWISGLLAELCREATVMEMHERPMVVPVPSASLYHPEIVGACADVMLGSRLCAQEFCFEFTDAALVANQSDINYLFRSYRQRGFRVAIDARNSWQAELNASTWLLVDTLRICLDSCEGEDSLWSMIEVARSAGVAIIAERALWRDADHLAEIGIEYGLKPRADA